MYHGNLAALNSAWKASYPSFDKVDVPTLLGTTNKVDPSAINSRRSFDLRKAMDLMQRDVLAELHACIKRKAPGSNMTPHRCVQSYLRFYDARGSGTGPHR
jgi:hypothetical protein